MGKAMRAVSEDKDAAELMGINVNVTISATFAIGSALAAIAGVLLCSAYPVLMPTTGSMPVFRYFDAGWPAGLHIADFLVYLCTLASLLSGIIYVVQNRHVFKEEKK